MDDDAGTLPPKQDFSGWFNDILWRAEIMDVRYPVKGLYVWYPYGFAVRKRTYAIIRELLDKDHQEALFPLLIPEQEFMKEAEHIKGFENEVYWVTRGGQSPLEVPLALRPTSETAIYPMYALWVRSHADLPLRLYQVVNTFRYETKATRPLIRAREISSFKEAHTVHATWEDAEEQAKEAIRLYRAFYDRLSIPVLVTRRPEWDKFPGADYTIAVDTIMPDGRTLQIGTVHHLGDNFSRTFGIRYEDEQGDQRYVFQTCYGISERSIAAAIGVHGDDRGLVLPPEVAPVQAIIIPIIVGKRKDEVLRAARSLASDLAAAGLRVQTDERDLRPGAKYYHWEMRGVPLRIEIGPRDIDRRVVTLVTRLGEKSEAARETVASSVAGVLSGLAGALLARAVSEMRNRISAPLTLEEAPAAVGKGVAVVSWCRARECAEVLEGKTGGSILGTDIGGNQLPEISKNCIVCGKEGTPTLLARTF